MIAFGGTGTATSTTAVGCVTITVSGDSYGGTGIPDMMPDDYVPHRPERRGWTPFVCARPAPLVRPFVKKDPSRWRAALLAFRREPRSSESNGE